MDYVRFQTPRGASDKKTRHQPAAQFFSVVRLQADEARALPLAGPIDAMRERSRRPNKTVFIQSKPMAWLLLFRHNFEDSLFFFSFLFFFFPKNGHGRCGVP